jgi:hypothetical protein
MLRVTTQCERLLRDGASPEQYCPPTAKVRPMSDNRREQHPGSWLGLVLRDVQFWVPVAVLIAGLLVLRWIS